jgi:hypothetical protein
MREDKARGELERYAKDVEMMRWENDAWRRREAEVCFCFTCDGFVVVAE